MKYIGKVILKNFQSHKNTTIEFDNGLNVILGPSDSGKTAILRGIRWALYNEPSGDYFIREGELECSVTIVFSDGIKVKRLRNKSKNSYILYSRNNEETRFEGFGTTVPEEIIDKTGIKKILLDSENSSSINLSDQLEGAFLLSEKTSVRANSIGRLVGVNLIDDALRETLKDNRNISINKKTIEESANKLKEELKGYDYLQLLEEKLSSIETIRKNIEFNENKIEKLKELQNKYNQLEKDKKVVSEVLSRLKDLSTVANSVKELEIKLSKIYVLNKLYKSIVTVISDKEQSIKQLEGLINIDSVEEKYKAMIRLVQIKDRYMNSKKLLENIKKDILQVNNILDKTKDVEKTSKFLISIEENINKLNNFSKINARYSDINKRVAIGKLYVEKLKVVEDINYKYIDLENKIKRLEQIKGVYNKHRNIIKDKKETQDLIDAYEKSIEEVLSKYKELLLKQEICPVCFSEIDGAKIDHIINQYN